MTIKQINDKKRQFPLSLNIQYFAEGGAGDSGGGEGGEGGQAGAGENGAAGDSGAPDFTEAQAAAIAKQVKAAEDALRNTYGKQMQDMKSTIEQLQNAGKTKEQLKKEAEEQLATGQRELLAAQNQFHASQQLIDAGLGKELLEFVAVAEGENLQARNETTDGRIKTLQALIDAEVKKKVDEKFKEGAYKPGNHNSGSTGGGIPNINDIITKNQIRNK